jgi:hypothetical protein
VDKAYELPPGPLERAWDRLRPLVRQEATPSGWRFRLRTTNFEQLLFLFFLVAFSYLMMNGVIFCVSCATRLSFFIRSLCMLPSVAVALGAMAQWRSQCIVEIDRHRVLVRPRGTLGVIDVAGVDVVEHVYSRLEVQGGNTEDRPGRRARFDVVVRGHDGTKLLLPLRAPTRARASVVAELLAKTIATPIVPEGYRG